jgi:hypothetical protein
LTTRNFRSATCTRGGNRTRTMLPSLDFESSASTNSATRALIRFSQCGAKISQKSNPENNFKKNNPLNKLFVVNSENISGLKRSRIPSIGFDGNKRGK